MDGVMNTDRDLGSAYRLATLDCPLSGDGCPTPEELSDMAQGRIASARREQIVAIVANCTRCAALLQVAGDLGEDAGNLPVDHPDVRRRMPRWLPAAMAAVALLAFLPLLWTPGDERVMRGEEAGIQPAPGARLDAAPERLSWTSEAGTACRVTLRTARADVLLHSGAILDGTLALDAATRAQLAPGDYLWTTECGGESQGPYAFTVTP
jgi:hypothetical protein